MMNKNLILMKNLLKNCRIQRMFLSLVTDITPPLLPGSLMRAQISPAEADQFLQQDEHVDLPKWSLIIFNDCYGGGPPSPNSAAQQLYDVHKRNGHSHNLSLFRTVNKIGPKGACRHHWQKYGFALIEKKYEKWVERNEYDGLESVRFYPEGFILDSVRQVLEKNGVLRKDEMMQIEKEAKSVVVRTVEYPEGDGE